MKRDAPPDPACDPVTPAREREDRRLAATRRLVVSLVVIFVVVSPAFQVLSNGPHSGVQWFQLTGSVVLAVLIVWRIGSTGLTDDRLPLVEIGLIVGLSIALFISGGPAWLGALAAAAACCGRFSRTPWPAILGAGACVAAGIVVIFTRHLGSGDTISIFIIAPLAALLAYTAARRAETLDMLRRTRAELARAAAAEERLRIARDLHDLLGHSLSLITLKAELIGRVLATDTERAAREVSELEQVARQSLSDVREAVAGFRQPDLAGELAAARQLLDAAGIGSQIAAPGDLDLPQRVDAALAWAVREGTTNVVRHSRATKVSISVHSGPDSATAEVRDNGPAAADDLSRATGSAGTPVATSGPQGRSAVARARPAFAGSGLAGLAERVRSLGGDLAAGAVEPHGFLLRVVVPLAQ